MMDETQSLGGSAERGNTPFTCGSEEISTIWILYKTSS